MLGTRILEINKNRKKMKLVNIYCESCNRTRPFKFRRTRLDDKGNPVQDEYECIVCYNRIDVEHQKETEIEIHHQVSKGINDRVDYI